jgi:3,4-dihydroxyphthalate decarboxylase
VGHVSTRIPETDHILMKAKGPDDTANEFVTQRDVILIDIEGQVLEAPQGLDSPNETAMHLAVYRKRPEVMSVIHAHPDWAVALMACEDEMVPMYRAYSPPSMSLVTQGIPIYPRSVTIVNDELGREFVETMGDKNICLLLGHGITTAGRSVEEAASVALNLYELARMNYLAYTIDKPRPVPDLGEDPRRGGEGSEERWRRRRQESSTGEPSDWRWQKQWLEKQGRAIW